MLLGIPLDNLVTAEAYREQLINAGFAQVEVELLSRDRVFGGLSRAIRHQHDQAAAWLSLALSDRWFMWITAWFFELLAKRAWVTPVIVSAQKP